MRILMISSSYYPQKGGLQEVVGRLAEELCARQNKVSVIANRYPVSLPGYERINGVPVRRFPFFAPDFEDVRQGRPGLYLACYFISIWTLAGFFQQLVSFRPDVVNIHFPLNQVPFYNLIHPIFPNIPVVVSLHGNDIEQYLSDNARYDQDVRKQTERALNCLLSRADLITAPSYYLLHQAETFHSDVKGKGVVIPNGVEALSPLAGKPIRTRPYILGVGRLTYRKGFDLLLKAFEKLAPNYSDLDLILLGEGEMRAELEGFIVEHGLSERVEMPGWVEHDQINRWMSQAEIVVVPSRQEGFGLVALEAMAAGRPVVGTFAGALPELLGDLGNPVVAPNAEDLMVGMLKLLNSPGSRLDIGQKNQIRSTAFQWNKVLERYINVYKNCVNP